jgi:hypothetical protein
MAADIKRQHTERQSHHPDGIALDQLHERFGHSHALAGETREAVDRRFAHHSVKPRFRQAI